MLSYSEKLLLVLYKQLYGKNYKYNPTFQLEDGVVVEHLQAQKAAYLFAQYNIWVDDFDYAWDRRGPFSSELQDILKGLDEKLDVVERYYTEFDNGKEKVLNELLTEKQLSRMNALVCNLSGLLTCQPEGQSQWKICELIGSLVFLSRTVMPGRVFDVVNGELQRRKKYLNDEAYNRSVWKTLANAGLLSI